MRSHWPRHVLNPMPPRKEKGNIVFHQTNRFISKRSLMLFLFCLVLAAVLIGRLFYLQVTQYDHYENIVLGNVSSTRTVAASRGVVYDRNMVQLASNYTVYRVFISPRDIARESAAYLEKNNKELVPLICSGLSEILGVEYETVWTETGKIQYADRTIQKNVEQETIDRLMTFISENGLSTCIHVEATLRRYYPYGSLASHVIGVVGTDGGLLGLELQYNSYLTGTPGRYITAHNAWGQSMQTKYETFVEPVDGASVISTLDMKIQYALENQLELTYVESQAQNRVTGIVMDVKTGGILGMATYPNFDLNEPYRLDSDSAQKLSDAVSRGDFAKDSKEYLAEYYNLLYALWNNKAVNDLYEPGSTMKVITTAMALEEGVVNPNEQFTCTGSMVVLKGAAPVKCHKIYGHGTHPFYYMLQQSCNPTMMTIAARLGRETFRKYFEAFGYTEKTGIDLPGESAPIYHSYGAFQTLELATSSFGQNFKVTATQQLTAICSIANGGYLVTPHVVSQVVDPSGTVLYEFRDTAKRQVVSESVCRTITDILEAGVSGDGGAKNTYVIGYHIAAKTGTSEVTDIRDENGKTIYRVGSTVAYAPAESPQVAVIIVVDRPACEKIYGSYVAAPYVAAVMEQILPYLGVERTYGDNEISKVTVTLRDYVGMSMVEVCQDLASQGIKYVVSGKGNVLTQQIPAGKSPFNKANGIVYLYCGDAQPDTYVEVPNLLGYTATQANQLALNLRLNLVIEGAVNTDAGSGAVVISQSPKAGERVLKGTTLTITMRHTGDTD